MAQTEGEKLFEAKVLEILQKNIRFKILRRTMLPQSHREFIQITLFIGGKEVSDSMIDITDITDPI